jgi:hypothetical protein
VFNVGGDLPHRALAPLADRGDPGPMAGLERRG